VNRQCNVTHDRGRLAEVKLVFIAGRHFDVQARKELATQVARLGGMPIVPDARIKSGVVKVQNYEFWVEGTSELLKRCDAVAFSHDYSMSASAVNDEALAAKYNIPRFYDITALEMWLRYGEYRP
jgi:hypothetical protein